MRESFFLLTSNATSSDIVPTFCPPASMNFLLIRVKIAIFFPYLSFYLVFLWLANVKFNNAI